MGKRPTCVRLPGFLVWTTLLPQGSRLAETPLFRRVARPRSFKVGPGVVEVEPVASTVWLHRWLRLTADADPINRTVMQPRKRVWRHESV